MCETAFKGDREHLKRLLFHKVPQISMRLSGCLLYLPTLGLRVIKKREEGGTRTRCLKPRANNVQNRSPNAMEWQVDIKCAEYYAQL
jgi:hypothetical protein